MNGAKLTSSFRLGHASFAWHTSKRLEPGWCPTLVSIGHSTLDHTHQCPTRVVRNMGGGGEGNRRPTCQRVSALKSLRLEVAPKNVSEARSVPVKFELSPQLLNGYTANFISVLLPRCNPSLNCMITVETIAGPEAT